MAHDSGDKTEKPTAKRVQDAREKGQVAKSSDFNAAIVLLAATGAMAYAGPFAFNNLFAIMKHVFGTVLRSPQALETLTPTTFNGILLSTLQATTWLLLPFLLCIMVAGALSNLVQVKPLFTVQAIAPKLDKINPLNGFKRLFSMRSIVEVVKALVKMGIIGTCGTLIIKKHLPMLLGLGTMEAPVAWHGVFSVLGELTGWCCVLFLVMGMIDWRYQAWELEKQLRMSKQDIKDERKNQEGDPMMKSRIRQMGMKMARTRQLAAIPTADVIITNPTHYAIAIKYDPDVAPAPIVVAKGKDIFAQKIKEIAKENNVPMVENKPLARALFPVVEVDAMIPPQLFIAVAEVLAYVFSKNKSRKMPKRKNPGGAN